MAFMNGTSVGGIIKLFSVHIADKLNPCAVNRCATFEEAFDQFLNRDLPLAFDKEKLKLFPTTGSDSLKSQVKREVNRIIAERTTVAKPKRKRTRY